MDFLIFDSTDTLLYVRNDAESAVHVEEEFRLSATFPLTEKRLYRGMRIGFTDQENVFQLFEIRQVTEPEPNEAQEIEAEHVAVAELLDEFVEDVRPTTTTAALAVTTLLTDTEWDLGTAASTGNSSMRAYHTSVWEALQTVRDTWEARIRPRITVSGTGITGRYIDILSNVPTNRGVRLEINKNIEQIGVTYDDRNLCTALYGWGKGQSTLAGDETNAAKLSFADTVWTVAGSDPADKPAGQKWVEDTAATALYGRNGRKRTGTVEFGDIEDAGELLQATWDELQKRNSPRVTVDCRIFDLYAYGYEHEQIILGDEVNIIVDPLGVELQATVIAMGRDLLNPENTRPTIGNYRAGIDYMTKDINSAVSDFGKLKASNPNLINGVINTMVTAILSSGTKFYTLPEDGSYVWETSDGTQAVRITGAGILLASSKIAGVWQWRTAITGSGAVADEITTGTLRAALITILGSDAFYWTGDNIYVINPSDTNKQIRIGKYDGTNYGIGFTNDGGTNWSVAINFDGTKLNSTDEERVSTLQTDVEGVTAIASAKSTIYVESSEPTGTEGNPLKSGDVWFDSSDDYKTYTYNGSYWVDGVVTGLKSSFIDIRNDIIKIVTGGSVDIQTDDFQIKNAAGNNMMRITVEDAETGEPGGQMELGEEGYPVKLGGNFVLQPEQGGTGYTYGRWHRVTSPPSDSLGNDGDGAIFYNGEAIGYSGILPAVGDEVSDELFGIYRYWNHIATSGWVDVGNLGTGLTLYGSYWSFTTPAGGLSNLTLQFSVAKYLSGTWYGWNINLPLTVAVFSGTDSGTVLGSNTFVPPINETLTNVPMTFETPLIGNTTFYIAIYRNSETQDKSKAIIKLSGVLIPGTSADKTEGFYIKSNGAWVDFLSSGPKMYCGSVTATSAGAAIDYSSANFTGVPYIVACYSQEGSAWSGDQGVLKISGKTTTGAVVEIGGSFTSRLVDWIAIGT